MYILNKKVKFVYVIENINQSDFMNMKNHVYLFKFIRKSILNAPIQTVNVLKTNYLIAFVETNVTDLRMKNAFVL